ncbi:DUF2971 domain-containing protein [uncultured Draconibacterium sp.]|uniref:DUF2971 domain-containing protein n=1 Tax=uncultured Draconibacterium sp. TaxID=1573823 RepID=UPI0032167126
MKKTQIFSKNLSSDQKELLKEIVPSFFDEQLEDFKLTLEEKCDTNILYHYTSMSTLQAILNRVETAEKDSNCFILRGTDIEYLNDKTEFILASQILSEELCKYEDSLENKENKHIAKVLTPEYLRNFSTFFGHSTVPFVTSFSENANSLPMWNTYGNSGKGVAIGIERISFKDFDYQLKSSTPTWVKCAYDSKLLTEILSRAAKDIYKMFEKTKSGIKFNGFPNTKSISAYFCLLKHFAFEYEQEWRLVKSYDEIEAKKEIKFHESNGLLKPYVEHSFPKSILKEVIIGPSSEKEISKKSLIMSLKRAGYLTNEKDSNKDYFVKISDSKIPYRRI